VVNVVQTMRRDADPGARWMDLWSDPTHWSTFGYRCKDDPRIMVRKRNPAMGWTMNWASPWAVPALLALLAIALVPMLGVVAVASSLAVGSIVAILAAFVAVPVTLKLILTFCRFLADER
jgi:hypothetical protein